MSLGAETKLNFFLFLEIFEQKKLNVGAQKTKRNITKIQ